MTTHRIDLVAGDPRRAREYGILLVSEQVYRLTGRGLHNPAFNHEIQVWENRPSKANGADPSVLVTPHGEPTDETYTFTTKAVSTVISDTPDPTRRTFGGNLAVGDVVELAVHGFVIGRFILDARPLRDPVLVDASGIAVGAL